MQLRLASNQVIEISKEVYNFLQILVIFTLGKTIEEIPLEYRGGKVQAIIDLYRHYVSEYVRINNSQKDYYRIQAWLKFNTNVFEQFSKMPEVLVKATQEYFKVVSENLINRAKNNPNEPIKSTVATAQNSVTTPNIPSNNNAFNSPNLQKIPKNEIPRPENTRITNTQTHNYVSQSQTPIANNEIDGMKISQLGQTIINPNR